MPAEQEHDQSLEEILYGDFYPKKSVTCEVEGLQIPFAPLSGEYIDYLGSLPEGVIVLSNYRIFAHGKDLPIINLPLGLIDNVEFLAPHTFLINCKNGQYYKCVFVSEKCAEWFKRLSDAMKNCCSLSCCFALAFCAWSRTEEACLEAFMNEILPRQASAFEREIDRMGFCLDPEVKAWRVYEANDKYGVCSTYPKKHIVPFSITDEMISDMARYRSHQRFPTVVWRDKRTGLVMARSSQPLPGMFWWRNTNDEAFISSIGESCRLNPGSDLFFSTKAATQPSKDLLLVDARSYASAFLNRAKGGGVECGEYYTNAEVVFMNLQNIHGIRKSFNHLRQICGSHYDESSWLTSLDQSKWLLHISNLLKSGLVIVDSIEVDGRSVLVHCSDGWDRTAQILSLALVLLDPHYRTIKGFRDLVEREWFEFGHKFADRCGQGLCSNDPNERSPIFLLWLDCVHQIHHQFPCFFEFNMKFLVKLAHHTYSCLFGDFLYNTDCERSRSEDRKTISVWGFLLNNPKLINPMYQHTNKVLRPQCSARNIIFWSQVYLAKSSTVVTSTFIEELKSGVDNIEGTGNDVNEINNILHDNPVDEKQPVQVVEPSASTLEPEVKKRSQSLDRQASGNEFHLTSNDTLQSLSLENFESNKLASHCAEEFEVFQSSFCDDKVVSFLSSLNENVELVTERDKHASCEDDKYMSPKISRTRQEEVHQPQISKDESSRRIFRQMDVDGLTLDVDLFGDVINKVTSTYQNKIIELQKQVEELKKLKHSDKKVNSNGSDCKDEVSSQASFDSPSPGSCASWELLSESQNRLVLWVPDHAVTHCGGCEREFWMGLRRHHCRSCGRIFCFECTRYCMPCPEQFLNKPVRVCENCYSEAHNVDIIKE